MGIELMRCRDLELLPAASLFYCFSVSEITDTPRSGEHTTGCKLLDIDLATLSQSAESRCKMPKGNNLITRYVVRCIELKVVTEERLDVLEPIAASERQDAQEKSSRSTRTIMLWTLAMGAVGAAAAVIALFVL